MITGKITTEVESDFADAAGYGAMKQRVAEVVIGEVTPIRHRYEELMRDVGELDRLLARGAEQAKGRVRAQAGRDKASGRAGPAQGFLSTNGDGSQTNEVPTMYNPPLEQVEKLAGQGNLVPVYREINADLETPVSAYLKIARPPTPSCWRAWKAASA